MSFHAKIDEWFTVVENLLDDGYIDYSEVRSLSDDGYALARKLRARARELERLAKNRGKYAHEFRAEARRLLNQADEIEDKISALWDAYREKRWR